MPEEVTAQMTHFGNQAQTSRTPKAFSNIFRYQLRFKYAGQRRVATFYNDSALLKRHAVESR